MNITRSAASVAKYHHGRRGIIGKFHETVNVVSAVSASSATSAYTIAIDKMIDSVILAEKRVKHAKLDNININASINLGAATISITKHVNNE